MQRLAGLTLLCALATSTACTGLVAGPDASTVTPVPASRDSAFVRARRAVQTEAFTLDVADSLGGRLVGTRYNSPTAKVGTAAACRVRLALQIRGDSQQAEVASTSHWLAPEPMEDKAPTVCEQERLDVLARVAQTIAPPTP
jgi:hypothetical protein